MPSKPPLAAAASAAGGGPLRDNNFDALRLIFATMVVVFHASLLSQAAGLSLGRHVSATFAVQAFFVVSGFLVTMSFEKSRSLADYAAKRLRRILPAYVFVVIVAALALSAASTLAPSDYYRNRGFWRYLGFNLLLSNFSAPALPGVFQQNPETAVNGSLWTIKIEVAFYCVVPFIVWGARRFGSSLTLLTVFLASLAWKLGFDLAFAGTGVEMYFKLAKQLPGQMSFFAGGAWAFYRTRNGKSIPSWSAALGLAAYWVSGGFLLEVVAPFCVTAIVYWAAVSAPRLPKVGKQGDFSYGLYLYHFPIVQVVIAAGVFRWSAPAGTALVFFAAGTCAVASWFFVEQPMLHKRAADRATVGRPHAIDGH